jgi:hypothetical protein
MLLCCALIEATDDVKEPDLPVASDWLEAYRFAEHNFDLLHASQSHHPSVMRDEGAMVVLGQDHPGEGATRLLDDVSAGGDDRPTRIGERVAASFVDQLERDQGSAMVHDDIGELF